MTSAYIKYLREETEREQAAPKPSPLRERFLTWHRSLPAVSRYRPFAMSEIEAAMGTQGRYISPILLDLGWSRHRKFSVGARGSYNRFWLPPHDHPIFRKDAVVGSYS